MTEEFLSTAYH